MYPVLLEIGNFKLYSYGFMIALGVLAAVLFLSREAPLKGYNYEKVLEIIVVTALAGMVGARILFIVLDWEWFVQDWSRIFQMRGGGLSFFGAFAGGLMVLWVYTRLQRIDFLNFADFLAPYLPLGYAFGRVGCFLNGCCYGTVSDVPWALPAALVDDLPRHPVQLYAAAGSLIIFFIMKYLQRRNYFRGFNLLSVIMLYGLLRFSVEFFREEEPLFQVLSPAQVFSAFLVLLSLLGLVRWCQKAGRGRNQSTIF